MNLKSNVCQSRYFLSRWVGWFYAAQVFFLLLISTIYLSVLPHFTALPIVTTKGIFLAWIFTVCAFMGQCAIFSFIGYLLTQFAVIIFPRRRFIFAVAIVVAATTALILISDSLTYYKYHFHMEGIVWDALWSGTLIQFFDLSHNEWIAIISLLILMGSLLVLIETRIAIFIWKKLQTTKPKIHGIIVAAGFFSAMFLSYVMYFNASYNKHGLDPIALSDDHMIVMVGQVVPYYNEMLGMWFHPAGVDSKKLAAVDNGYYVQNTQINQPLQYPLQALKFASSQHLYNIVVIVIDTWRFDMLNSLVTPHLASFASQCWNFTDHYSGGNCTRPGIFSLFYGLPPTYWTAMDNQKQGPILIHQLLAHHYQMGVYGSASLNYPPFDRTVFREVKNLQVYTPGVTTSARDQKITQEFQQFINHRDKTKPFFNFLFYDEVHNWCGSSQPYSKPFQPAIHTCDRMMLNGNVNIKPYLNRYKNAVYFVDQLVNKDLQTLQQQDLLKNTIVIITGDHGEEFNDEHLGNWGHASAYDPYQVKTPFIVSWPGQTPRIIAYQTSHYDVVPTLLQGVFNCTNPILDYSLGVPLTVAGHRPFLIVGSYVDYAILKDHHIVNIYPGGNYGVENEAGHIDSNANINFSSLASVFKKMNRFFRES